MKDKSLGTASGRGSGQVKPVVRHRPWLIQSDKIYKEKGAWEELADFEHWLREKLGEELAQIYDDLDPVFQINLYGIFCSVVDENNKEQTRRFKNGDRVRSIYHFHEPNNIGTIRVVEDEYFIEYDGEPGTLYYVIDDRYLEYA